MEPAAGACPTLRGVTLLVVRHAHAGDRSTWTGDDELRPLSKLGELEAEAIGVRLELQRPERILSSRAVRCRETVVPLAQRLGVEVETDDRLLEGAGAPEVASLLRDIGEQTAVLCSHGDVIPHILHQLVDQGMQPEHALQWAKGSTWVVERNGNGWGAGTYVPATDVGATGD